MGGGVVCEGVASEWAISTQLQSPLQEAKVSIKILNEGVSYVF